MRVRWLALLMVGGLPVQAAQLSLSITNAPADGMVYCEVYQSAADFENFRTPFRVKSFSLADPEPFVMEDLPAGEYAVVLFFDQNGNGRLDRNFLGIPREPIALANGYEPRGPPVFARARIRLAEEATLDIPLSLRRPLGKRGRIGIGVGMLGRSSPYRGDSGAVLQAIPALTYTGNRVQILGPMAQVGVVDTRHMDLALKGQYRMGVYDENDSSSLSGMGDRKDTFLAGVSLKLDVPFGGKLQAEYLHDVANRIGGGTAGLTLGRSIPVRRGRLSPYLGLLWLSSDLARHDFGVPAAKATPDRPSYAPGSVVHPVLGVSGSLEVTERILIILRVEAEWLADDVTASPIVDEDLVFSGFGAMSYQL